MTAEQAHKIIEAAKVFIYGEIEMNTEWLETIEGDEVECISVENIKGILNRRLAELEKLIQQQ